jgi:nicotinate-nucleotide adenylyltransferase
MPGKLKLALLGGTFNPIHVGHLFVAEEVRLSFGYDRIVFVPAFRPAHKDLPGADEPEMRLAMVRTAVAGNPNFIVDDCEIRRRQTSYTMDTIQELQSRYALEGRPGLIIGDDLIAGFPAWKNVEALLAAVKIIVARRHSSDRPPFAAECDYLENILVDVSSSDIRDRVRSGKAWRYLVPDSVHAFILEHGLYAGEQP